MEPVRLEILLDDKTLKGMRSVEGNLSGIGLYAKQVIAQLEQELLELQKQYRNAMAAGTNTDAQDGGHPGTAGSHQATESGTAGAGRAEEKDRIHPSHGR